MKQLFLMIFAMVCFILETNAQIIHIPADQPTIQAGINSASEGDTILVAEGSYFENINFKGKPITVASQFILDGDTAHISRTVIDGSQSTNPDSASVVTDVVRGGYHLRPDGIYHYRRERDAGDHPRVWFWGGSPALRWWHFNAGIRGEDHS